MSIDGSPAIFLLPEGVAGKYCSPGDNRNTIELHIPSPPAANFNSEQFK
jgi:hypothetical protein